MRTDRRPRSSGSVTGWGPEAIWPYVCEMARGGGKPLGCLDTGAPCIVVPNPAGKFVMGLQLDWEDVEFHWKVDGINMKVWMKTSV